jgi:hypothetical protein
MRHKRSTVLNLLALVTGLLSASTAGAQDLVPGAYTPTPVRINVVTVGMTVSKGDLSFDPTLPVEEGQATLGAFIYGINRTLSIARRSANVGVGVPLVLGHVQGVLAGQFAQASRGGPADLMTRIAVNVYGAPAMTRQEFGAFRQTNIVGLSLVTSIPVGQYDSARLINIGTHRWSFKPEVGLSHRRGRWTVEGDFGATFFTDNTEYVQGTRSQAPIVSAQGHLIYAVRPGLWIAGDGNFWKGGRLTTAGVDATLDQSNSRLGVTVAVPFARQQLRFAYSFGAFTRLGGDFQTLGVSYSYAWAAH